MREGYRCLPKCVGHTADIFAGSRHLLISRDCLFLFCSPKERICIAWIALDRSGVICFLSTLIWTRRVGIASPILILAQSKLRSLFSLQLTKMSSKYISSRGNLPKQETALQPSQSGNSGFSTLPARCQLGLRSYEDKMHP